METNNYMQVQPDGQFYTELAMIQRSLQFLLPENGWSAMEYIIKGIDNSIKLGYKIVQDGSTE